MSVVASVLRYSEFGDPAKVLHVEKETVSDPANGEVLVKTLGAPINPADINTIQGRSLDKGFPYWLVNFKSIFLQESIP